MIRLRDLRLAAGIRTQQEFARLAGVAQGQISDLETGVVKQPTLRTAAKLVAGLNARLAHPITIDALLAPEDCTESCTTI
jgi:transcriptional regulator with XRE-family HTH domain